MIRALIGWYRAWRDAHEARMDELVRGAIRRRTCEHCGGDKRYCTDYQRWN